MQVSQARRYPRDQDRVICRSHNLDQRMSCRLKDFRRIDTSIAAIFIAATGWRDRVPAVDRIVVPDILPKRDGDRTRSAEPMRSPDRPVRAPFGRADRKVQGYSTTSISLRRHSFVKKDSRGL